MNNLLSSNKEGIQKLLALFDISFLLSADIEFNKAINKFDNAQKLEDFVLEKANKMSSYVKYKLENNTFNTIKGRFNRTHFRLPLTGRIITEM